ncbi:hypothetical protein [Chitinivibrio alkaliphilus]|uniref:Uncharacterized protein n=1 Tax=Chitinivibrio alkaliphilus ACht1 TaxID=1313304 RepID=U7D6P5_9BACT|nr:hypothetical protein [Chitinivibrio alkaliphilus]ERP31241.1 hypothetical protein CALK_1858 [Chitinivibrio alkaliphilus ACht1]
MNVTFVFMLLLGAGGAVITQSIIDRWWRKAILPLLFLLVPLFSAPHILDTSSVAVQKFFMDPAFVSLLSLFMICEGVIGIFLGLRIVQRHYQGRDVTFGEIFFYLPPTSALAGVLWFPYQMLFLYPGASSLWLIERTAVALVTLFCILSVLLRRVIAPWGIRVEMKLLLYLVQIVVAAFLPLLIHPPEIYADEVSSTVPTFPLWVLFAGFGCIAFGFFFRLVCVSKGVFRGSD